MTGNFQVIFQVPVVFEQQTEEARVENEPDAIVMRVPVQVEDQRGRTVDGDQDQGTSEFFV